MSRRNLIGLVVLGVLVAIAARILLARGLGFRFDAKPAALAAPYSTEEAWVIDEITRDIVEMAAHARRGVAGEPSVAPAGQSGVYLVVVDGLVPSAVTVDLAADLWSPQAFASLAKAAVGGQPSAATAGDGGSADALRHLTARVLTDESQRVSARLTRDMLDAAAHESAALIVGAFGLREATGRMADVRWAMNRMTAHLAMASALRGGSQPSLDGRLANVLLLLFGNHQARALAAADELLTDTPGAVTQAWVQAIRLRVTEDWRLLPHPKSASRLEQREYFRARRAAVRSVRATKELEDLGLPLEIDWVRIIQAFSVSGEDGALVRETLDMERAELDDVYMQLTGRALVDSEISALNAAATRCLHDGHVEVLPWGAWAEFAQRHIGVIIGRYDSYLRFTQAAPDAADARKLMLHRELGDLWIFPSASIWWTKGNRGTEADLRYIDEAIHEGVTRPHRLPAKAWSFLEMGSKYEPVRAAMPPAGQWFLAPAVRTSYDAAARVQDSGHAVELSELEALVNDAPHDWLLTAAYLTRRFGARVPLEEITRRAGDRMRYDTRPVSLALEMLGDDERRLPILKTACGFSVSQCLPLAQALAQAGHDDDAAHAYEAALMDPAVDTLAKANWSGWLVEYYRAHQQVSAALRLAEEGASTGAYAGRLTAATLYERLGRFDAAEELHQANASDYESPAELIGFYYRAKKRGALMAPFTQELERIFPVGLDSRPFEPVQPTVGVYVEKDSLAARAINIHAGDVIVGVDGYHVENTAQYRVVRALPLDGPVRLTLWRAGLIEAVIADRHFVPEFRIADYPVKGWIAR